MSANRVVVVLPGTTWGPAVPQLFLPTFAAIRRGADRRALEWAEGDLATLPAEDRGPWVEARLGGILEGLEPAASLVVGKSLGSLAARAVAAASLPAIWVTPLLTDGSVVDGLRRATAPFLLVGGTADPTWDGAVAARLTPHVVELPGADHGLFVPGPLRASVELLGRLAEESERFLDDVVWPRTVPGPEDPA